MGLIEYKKIVAKGAIFILYLEIMKKKKKIKIQFYFKKENVLIKG